jgi:hypothetical protein
MALLKPRIYLKLGLLEGDKESRRAGVRGREVAGLKEHHKPVDKDADVAIVMNL